MKVLILGATGLLGARLFKRLSKIDNLSVFGTSRNKSTAFILKVDELTSTSIKETVEKVKPNVVINCIGISGVEYCEENPSLCFDVNYSLVKNVSFECQSRGVKFIHISSAMVYSTSSDNINREIPLNYYGTVKLLADNYIKETNSNYIILRPTPILFHSQENQRSGILDVVLGDGELNLVSDFKTNYIFINDFLNIIYLAIKSPMQVGVYDVCGELVLSPYKLALTLVRFKKDIIKRTNIVTLGDYGLKTKVNRPNKVILNNNRIISEVGYKFPCFISSLKEEMSCER
ncbi:hypothetical protein BCU90_07625 [Vibrio lentus]|uniref:SDR family oxidoreductase n=1 Tax=Vibrio TaxID=662 RepID=UPI000C817489|nr:MULTISPECIES: sugar nucleotide-binding protein [Vibrio]MDN2667519.1 sugar nucleotide-binding protein [Vibrio sp. 14N.309.X.WAT.E.F5]PMG48447.1 hypothetical protein BCU90_07625 [Vibrio lentus]